jgi:hypothetical protein
MLSVLWAPPHEVHPSTPTSHITLTKTFPHVPYIPLSPYVPFSTKVLETHLNGSWVPSLSHTPFLTLPRPTSSVCCSHSSHTPSLKLTFPTHHSYLTSFPCVHLTYSLCQSGNSHLNKAWASPYPLTHKWGVCSTRSTHMPYTFSLHP